MSPGPLLSIAIPAYNRPKELTFGLYRFVAQIIGRYEDAIEIVVSDDASPENGLDDIRLLAQKYKFIKYRRYAQNVGLERNLIACTEGCGGSSCGYSAMMTFSRRMTPLIAS